MLLERGLADDGQRFGRRVWLRRIVRGGSLREGSGFAVFRCWGGGGLADDGKRIPALDVVCWLRRIVRGGSLREGSG